MEQVREERRRVQIINKASVTEPAPGLLLWYLMRFCRLSINFSAIGCLYQFFSS